MRLSVSIPIKKKIFISHFLAIILVSGSIGTYFYLSAAGNLMDSIKTRLLNSAAFIGQAFTADDFASIQGETDTAAPAYVENLKKLRALKRTNQDIAFLYVMRREGDKVVFVMDSDETERQAKPGAVYPNPPEELLAGFDNSSVDSHIYSDAWGAFVSGYAPLPGGEGRYLIGMDMRADEVSKKLRFLRLSGLFSLLCSLLFAGIFSKLLGGNLVRRIELLTLQCKAIAHGGVSEGVDYEKGDELDALIHAFNTMSGKLSASHAETDKSRSALEQSYTLLEQKVADRTRDLSTLNDRLTTEISEREKVKAQKEALIAELQQALSEVKTLSGLLPICASCKKIRDDQGYWNQIECYIREHSEAEFSHSICPDCAKKLYKINLT